MIMSNNQKRRLENDVCNVCGDEFAVVKIWDYVDSFTVITTSELYAYKTAHMFRESKSVVVEQSLNIPELWTVNCKDKH